MIHITQPWTNILFKFIKFVNKDLYISTKLNFAWQLLYHSIWWWLREFSHSALTYSIELWSAATQANPFNCHYGSYSLIVQSLAVLQARVSIAMGAGFIEHCTERNTFLIQFLRKWCRCVISEAYTIHKIFKEAIMFKSLSGWSKYLLYVLKVKERSGKKQVNGP